MSLWRKNGFLFGFDLCLLELIWMIVQFIHRTHLNLQGYYKLSDALKKKSYSLYETLVSLIYWLHFPDPTHSRVPDSPSLSNYK